MGVFGRARTKVYRRYGYLFGTGSIPVTVGFIALATNLPSAVTM